MKSSYIKLTFILMLSLRGDLVEWRNTKELWRIMHNKQDCTRQQHLPGHWATVFIWWTQKFSTINSSEAVRKMSALLSEDTIEISSSSSVLSHLKFIVSNFFCWWRMRWKLAKLKHNYNWFYKLSFLNRLQTIVMLIYWIAWVRSSCMTHV